MKSIDSGVSYEWRLSARPACLGAPQVIAKAYDNPIPGYKTSTVGNLRLWEALPVSEFNLDAFNKGEYDKVPAPALAIHRRLSPACSTCFSSVIPYGFCMGEREPPLCLGHMQHNKALQAPCLQD